MRQESGGQEDITSSAGAMGLMQVMPATYAQLASQYGLGNDPYEPHDNMMAGTAYLRQMYDRYGSPRFLAAYNAGPGRVDAYLARGGSLPDETVNYVAAISPHLGTEFASSVPIGGGPTGGASGCDPNAAYDPRRPCRSAPSVQATVTPVATRIAPRIAPGPPILINAPPCDPDVAYDPSRACRDVPSAMPNSALASNVAPCDPDAAYDPRQVCRPVPQLPAPPMPVMQLARAELPRSTLPPPAMPRSVPNLDHMGGTWAIEVGVYPRSTQANDVAVAARSRLPDLLAGARINVAPTTPFGGAALYRAQLTSLSLLTARTACGKLTQSGLGCTLVLPGNRG
jgi:hypothetical protein